MGGGSRRFGAGWKGSARGHATARSARGRVSSQERLDAFACAGDEVRPRRRRPGEHGAVEGLARDEVRELRGGRAGVGDAQQAGSSQAPQRLRQGVAQGLLRDGFDFARHPLSVLANGPGGWIQTPNFAITGLLVIAASIGIGRALGRGSRAMTWLLGAYGAAMIAAAIFPADPVDGFPPGTPEGFPISISTTGLLHFFAGALAFASLAFSALAAAWTFWRRHVPSLS